MIIAFNHRTGEKLTKNQYLVELENCVTERLNEERFFERYLEENFSMTEVFNFTEAQKLKAMRDFAVFVNEEVLDCFKREYTFENIEDTEN